MILRTIVFSIQLVVLQWYSHQHDSPIMTAAMNTLKRFDTQGGDFHLIVGSWYYMSIYTHHWFPVSDGKRPILLAL